jgi:hypothetical protein
MVGNKEPLRRGPSFSRDIETEANLKLSPTGRCCEGGQDHEGNGSLTRRQVTWKPGTKKLTVYWQMKTS